MFFNSFTKKKRTLSFFLAFLLLAEYPVYQISAQADKKNIFYGTKKEIMMPFSGNSQLTTFEAKTSSDASIISSSPAVSATVSPTVSAEENKITNLYIKYLGETLTQPATLDKTVFLVTALYEDGSTHIINDYTFTTSTEITQEGNTTISISYEQKTADCQVSMSIPVTPKLYSITFDTRGGSLVAPIYEIEPKSYVPVSATSKKAGYWFRGWFLEDTCQTEYSPRVPITKDLILYAKWEEKENKAKDTMTVSMNLPEFATALSVDLTGHLYGPHVLPTVSSIKQETVISAVKNVVKSKNYSFYAFDFTMNDYTFQERYPLQTTITLPSNYDANKITVYYTPDNQNIEGACQGTALATNTYQFPAYASGTYIVIQEQEDTSTVDETATTPQTPSVSLSLNKTSILIDSQTFATIKYHNFDERTTDTSEIEFKWKSSNSKVASVDQDGIISANSVGKAIISVVSTDKEKTYQASATIYVTKTKVKIKNLTVKKKKLTVSVGKSIKIPTTITPAKASNPKLHYTSSNPKIANVFSGGKVTGLKKGTCKITISTTDGSKIKKTITITVN